MKAPTEKEIRKEVYANTHQETSDQVEWFITGALFIAEKWKKAIEDESINNRG